MIKKNQKILNMLQFVLDMAAILISIAASWYLRFHSGIVPIWFPGILSFWDYFNPVVMFLPFFALSLYLFKLYDPQRKNTFSEEVYAIVKANSTGIFMFVLFLFLSKQMHYSRVMLAIHVVLVNLLMITERGLIRLMLRRMRAKGYNLKHIILVGDSDASRRIITSMAANRHWGYNIIGVISTGIVDADFPARHLGILSDLEEVITRENADEVFITLELNEYKVVDKIIRVCEKAGVKTYIVPDYYRYLPARPFVEDVDGLPIINIRYIPLDNPLYAFVKRLLDILISGLGLLAISPVLLIVAILVRLDSPGHVIFVQERVGLNRKPFNMYKFRSMRLQTDEEEHDKWTTKDDPRKTKVGNFIRKTSIDELPQLFNVLKGDMSLVGPRPERPYFVEKFKEEVPRYMIKHQVRPGITGWAQVQGWRGDTSIVRRIECDIYYIENWSLVFDARIFLMTFFKRKVKENAY
ncbi:undecaprenyl-phosphate glucose phosphotransferase [Youngiibacter fragilis]|uniref:UDP-phosphate glucose phosphotransferase n=1 Tax=Youngiibacter fragilis 232.1 TaxID=994573 RepID=V7I492_9CLOT|nr:undecaprenyl-phosphate glucose phosphotransferase [Youngiibacter fragilis]ETA80688.1 UDP-phosphate glucose phosphotransferase [Youngiibacter fragilis 232.1]